MNVPLRTVFAETVTYNDCDLANVKKILVGAIWKLAVMKTCSWLYGMLHQISVIEIS